MEICTFFFSTFFAVPPTPTSLAPVLLSVSLKQQLSVMCRGDYFFLTLSTCSTCSVVVCRMCWCVSVFVCVFACEFSLYFAPYSLGPIVATAEIWGGNGSLPRLVWTSYFCCVLAGVPLTKRRPAGRARGGWAGGGNSRSSVGDWLFCVPSVDVAVVMLFGRHPFLLLFMCMEDLKILEDGV